MMHNDTDAILDDLLSRWHWWSKHTADRAGLPGRAPVFGTSLSNSQYDWENNVENEMIESRIMRGFDAAISKVPQPYFTALSFQARNLVTGRNVWLSPRLPRGEELEVMILEARNLLLKELTKDGVLC